MSWEKKFRKEFGGNSMGDVEGNEDYVIDFIKETLEAERKEANITHTEIISKYILETKDIKTIDLLEKIQKDILNGK